MKLVLTVLVALLGQRCFGATNTAASLSAFDVQAAINACASSGDVVQLPVGTNNWINTNAGVSFKSLMILGAGGPGLATKTFIGITNNGTMTGIGIATGPTNYVVLANFGISNITPLTASYVGSVVVSGFNAPDTVRARCTGLTVCLSVTGSGDRGILPTDCNVLIDHCYLQNWAMQAGHVIDIGSDINHNYGVTNWHRPIAYGTTNCTCIEDCTFDFLDMGDNFLDAYGGVNVTVRYCHVTNSIPGWHGADSNCRGLRLFEMYMCDFHSRNGWIPEIKAMYGNARSGSGVVWSNAYDIAWAGANGGHYNQYRARTAYPSSCIPGGGALVWFLPSGGLQGGMNGAQIVDGNFAVNGYPGLDQIGRGSFSVNPVVWTANFLTNNYEALEGFYNWSNNVAGVIDPISVAGDDQNNPIPNMIKSGRDYFDGVQKPGYTPLPYPHPLITAALNAQQIAKVTTLRVGVTKVGP